MMRRSAWTAQVWLFMLAMAFVVTPGVAAAASDDRLERAMTETLTPAQRTEIAAEALKAFEEGLLERERDSALARAKFREALRRAQQLRADGTDTAGIRLLEGNCYSQLGDPGRAIAAYRAGLARGGFRSDLSANLRAAQASVRTPVVASAPTAMMLRWRDWTRSRPLTAPVTVLLIGWAALFAAVLLPAGGRRRMCLGAAAALCAAAGVVVATAMIDAQLGPRGVLTGESVVVRQGAGEMFDPVYAQPLSGGVEVRLQGERAGWRAVRLPDGTEGWIPAHMAVVIDGEGSGGESDG